MKRMVIGETPVNRQILLVSRRNLYRPVIYESGQYCIIKFRRS